MQSYATAKSISFEDRAPNDASVTSPSNQTRDQHHGTYTWIRTSRLLAATCSTTLMGAVLAVPLATISAPSELRGVVLSMSLGLFTTIMAAVAGAALITQNHAS